MIVKSYDINKLNLKTFSLFLFYGKNQGLKNDALDILIKDKNKISRL